MICVSAYLRVFILIIVFTSGKSDFKPEGAGAHWFYPADENWPITCNGKKQSPIDISDRSVKKRIEPFPEINLVNYDKKIMASIMNDGHTVKITIDPRDDLYVIGGGLRGTFALQQIHFHWKSEHTLNGKRIPLEAHFVHANKKTDTYRIKRHAGITENDDLQVLAVFYMLSLDNNTDISNVVDTINEITTVGSTKNIEFIPRLLLPKNLAQFYRYEGSLTTPPCFEIVHWTLFSSMVPVSLDQYDIIRETEGFGGKYTKNYRHVMPLNNRVVKFYNGSTEIIPNIKILAIIMVTFMIRNIFQR